MSSVIENGLKNKYMWSVSSVIENGLKNKDREKLINMVREIPCLWDPETKYMDTEVTSIEWRKIGDEMGLSGKIL